MRTIGELQDPARDGDRVVAEVLDFGGDANRETTRIEECDGGAAAATREQRIPRRRDVVANGRDEADTGNRDASF